MTLPALLAELTAQFPEVNFVAGRQASWSPYHRTVTYVEPPLGRSATPGGFWSLLHETGHASLNHARYRSDVELLRLEAAAWQRAAAIGQKYGVTISEDHIQDCLDTYRDWLHGRSKCPTCEAHSAQTDPTTYTCLNCGTSWHVSASRFCRVHRRVVKKVAV